ncbi:hypothetical protein L1049_013678 [Liquidambar formosana]|uniref:Uncharacterized protein n=1 Tax=Liquidambar formosana TaxID=63359 RepID=A0AAP0RP35_LIQFO
MHNQRSQNSDAVPPVENHEFQSVNVASAMGNRDPPDRNMTPTPASPPQGWNCSSKGMPSSMQNQNDMPPPVQNGDFQNRSMPPPVQNLGFQNRDIPQQMQKGNFYNGGMPPQMPNRDFRNLGGPPPVQNRDSRETGNILTGENQNLDINIEVMPNRGYQNWDMHVYTRMGKVQNRDYQNPNMTGNVSSENASGIGHHSWDSSNNVKIGNSPCREHQSRDVPNEQHEAVGDRKNFCIKVGLTVLLSFKPYRVNQMDTCLSEEIGEM